MAVALDIFAMDTDIHAFKSGIVGISDGEDVDEDDDVEDIFADMDDRQQQGVGSSNLDFDSPISSILDDTGSLMMPLFDLDGHVENVVELKGNRKTGNRVIIPVEDDDDILDLFGSQDDHQQQPMDYQGGACVLGAGTDVIGSDRLCDVDIMAPCFELNPDVNPGKGKEPGDCCNFIEFSLEEDKLEQGVMYDDDDGVVRSNSDHLCNGIMKLDIEDDRNDDTADCKMLEFVVNDTDDLSEQGVEYGNRNLGNMCDIEEDMTPLFDLSHKQVDQTVDCKLQEFVIETPEFEIDVPEFPLAPPPPEFAINGIPDVANGIPEFANGTSEFANGTPEFVIETQEFANDTPEFAIETPEFAIETPEFVIESPEFAIETPEFAIETQELADDTPEFAVNMPRLTVETPEQVEISDIGNHTMDECNMKNVPQINFEEKKYQIGNRESGCSADFPHYNADFISYFSDESDVNSAKNATLTPDQQRLTLTPHQQLNFDSDQDIANVSQSASSDDSDEEDDDSYDLSEDVSSRRSEVSESEDSRSEYSELTPDLSDMVEGQEYYMSSDTSTCPGTGSEMEEEEEEDEEDSSGMSEDDNGLDETFCVKDGEQDAAVDIDGAADEFMEKNDDADGSVYNTLSRQAPPSSIKIQYGSKSCEMEEDKGGGMSEEDDDDVLDDEFCVKDEKQDVEETDDDVTEIDTPDGYKEGMNNRLERRGSTYNVLTIQVPDGYRFKYRTLHDLLPGFQKFLDDLCQIKLTSDLEEKAKDYRQRITDYIEQFSSQPGDVPPPLPDPGTFPRDSDPNIDILIAEERQRSRQHFAGAQFSNTLPITLNGHTSHGDLEDIPDKLKRQSAQPEEDFYEAPMEQTSTIPPPVPDSVRPLVTAPIRQIDDLPCYDDPDSPQMSPPPVTGNPPRLPGPTINQGYHVLNPDGGGHDSGGTFTTSTISSCTDDGELYEDVNDNGDFDDSFSDYESDELEVLNPDTDSGVISPSSAKEKKKKKKDDWQNFLNFLEAENNTADHTGRLHYYDAKSTLKHIFKPKAYFCAATNARLLVYLPKKEYGKPNFEIQLHSGCEISGSGKDSNKEYGIQIQAKKGKTYNFSSSSQMDADKWIETLKKYTNQGLEYDVTHVRTEHSESVEGDPTSPPAGMEDLMIGKFETLMKKVFKNKKKKHPPQITEEDGVLQGYANVMGALYGEPSWKKKWIVIKNHQFYCHKTKNDDYEFAFSLKEVELAAPEAKVVKKGREGALKFHKDNETLIYFEALNPLDVGKIMKQALNAMMMSSTASKSSIVRRETTVEKITKFYEALETGVVEQSRGSVDVDNLYINTQIGEGRRSSSMTSTPTSPDSTASTPEVSGVQDQDRLYVNTTVGGAGGAGKSRKLISQPPTPVKVDDNDNFYEDTANVMKANIAPSAAGSDDIYEDTANPPPSSPDDIYDDTAVFEPVSPPPLPETRKSKTKSLPPANKDTSAGVYGNIKVKNPFTRRKKDVEKEPEEEVAVPEEPNDKKEKKKKKDKKDKKKKKGKKDEIEHPDEPPPDPPQSYDTPQPTTKPALSRTLTAAKENKFKDSDKKHLLDADRLQGDMKDVENRKKELTELKKEIQNKRKSVVDTTEKAKLDEQMKTVQSEWSQCSKRLAELEEEIERATKATVPQAQLMKNSPASLRRGGSGSRRSSGSSQGADVGFGLTSPERECATSDMSLQDKIRRFQQK